MAQMVSLTSQYNDIYLQSNTPSGVALEGFFSAAKNKIKGFFSKKKKKESDGEEEEKKDDEKKKKKKKKKGWFSAGPFSGEVATEEAPASTDLIQIKDGGPDPSELIRIEDVSPSLVESEDEVEREEEEEKQQQHPATLEEALYKLDPAYRLKLIVARDVDRVVDIEYNVGDLIRSSRQLYRQARNEQERRLVVDGTARLVDTIFSYLESQQNTSDDIPIDPATFFDDSTVSYILDRLGNMDKDWNWVDDFISRVAPLPLTHPARTAAIDALSNIEEFHRLDATYGIQSEEMDSYFRNILEKLHAIEERDPSLPPSRLASTQLKKSRHDPTPATESRQMAERTMTDLMLRVKDRAGPWIDDFFTLMEEQMPGSPLRQDALDVFIKYAPEYITLERKKYVSDEMDELLRRVVKSLRRVYKDYQSEIEEEEEGKESEKKAETVLSIINQSYIDLVNRLARVSDPIVASFIRRVNKGPQDKDVAKVLNKFITDALPKFIAIERDHGYSSEHMSDYLRDLVPAVSRIHKRYEPTAETAPTPTQTKPEKVKKVEKYTVAEFIAYVDEESRGQVQPIVKRIASKWKDSKEYQTLFSLIRDAYRTFLDTERKYGPESEEVTKLLIRTGARITKLGEEIDPKSTRRTESVIPKTKRPSPLQPEASAIVMRPGAEDNLRPAAAVAAAIPMKNHVQSRPTPTTTTAIVKKVVEEEEKKKKEIPVDGNAFVRLIITRDPSAKRIVKGILLLEDGHEHRRAFDTVVSRAAAEHARVCDHHGKASDKAEKCLRDTIGTLIQRFAPILDAIMKKEAERKEEECKAINETAKKLFRRYPTLRPVFEKALKEGNARHFDEPIAHHVLSGGGTGDEEIRRLALNIADRFKISLAVEDDSDEEVKGVEIVEISDSDDEALPEVKESHRALPDGRGDVGYSSSTYGTGLQLDEWLERRAELDAANFDRNILKVMGEKIGKAKRKAKRGLRISEDISVLSLATAGSDSSAADHVLPFIKFLDGPAELGQGRAAGALTSAGTKEVKVTLVVDEEDATEYILNKKTVTMTEYAPSASGPLSIYTGGSIAEIVLGTLKKSVTREQLISSDGKRGAAFEFKVKGSESVIGHHFRASDVKTPSNVWYTNERVRPTDNYIFFRFDGTGKDAGLEAVYIIHPPRTSSVTFKAPSPADSDGTWAISSLVRDALVTPEFRSKVESALAIHALKKTPSVEYQEALAGVSQVLALALGQNVYPNLDALQQKLISKTVLESSSPPLSSSVPRDIDSRVDSAFASLLDAVSAAKGDITSLASTIAKNLSSEIQSSPLATAQLLSQMMHANASRVVSFADGETRVRSFWSTAKTDLATAVDNFGW